MLRGSYSIVACFDRFSGPCYQPWPKTYIATTHFRCCKRASDLRCYKGRIHNTRRRRGTKDGSGGRFAAWQYYGGINEGYSSPLAIIPPRQLSHWRYAQPSQAQKADFSSCHHHSALFLIADSYYVYIGLYSGAGDLAFYVRR